MSSLQRYCFEICHKRENFKCQYSGANGTKSFDTRLTLSYEHLLPKGHRDRDNPDYIVTAYNFCNTADNHCFKHAEKRGLGFDRLIPDELVAQRSPYVKAVGSCPERVNPVRTVVLKPTVYPLVLNMR